MEGTVCAVHPWLTLNMRVKKTNMYTTVQNVNYLIMFIMFLKEISYAHKGCMYLIKITVKTVTRCKIFLKYISFFYIYSCAAETVTVFSGFFDEYKVQKNSIYLKLDFCSNIKVTFEQSDLSFLNKSINLKKKYTKQTKTDWPQTFEWYWICRCITVTVIVMSLF